MTQRPSRSQKPNQTFWRKDVCRSLLSFVVLCVSGSTLAFGQVAQSSSNIGNVPRNLLPSQRAIDYDFRDVNIDEVESWLGWIGIKSPVDVSGEVTGWFWAQRSSNGWLKFSEYWLEGELESLELYLNGWKIAAANLRLGYKNGVWYLGRLQGKASPPDQLRNVGSFHLRGELPAKVDAVLSVSGEIEDVQLGSFTASFGQDFDVQNRGGSLVFSGTVPFSEYQNLAAWQARASLDIDRLRFPTLQTDFKVIANATIKKGVWELEDSRIALQSGRDAASILNVTANGDFSASLPFSLQANSDSFEVRALGDQFGYSSVTDSINGYASLQGKLLGNIRDGVDAGFLKLRSSRLVAFGTVVEDVDLDGIIKDSGIAISASSGSVWGGKLKAESNLAEYRKLSTLDAMEVAISFEEINIPNLIAGIVDRAEIEGRATGGMLLEMSRNMSDKSDQIIRWGSTGKSTVTQVRINEQSVGPMDISWSKNANSSKIDLRLINRVQTGELVSDIGLQLKDDDRPLFSSTMFNGFMATGTLKDYVLPVNIGQSDEPVILTSNGDFTINGTVDNLIHSGSVRLKSVKTVLEDKEIALNNAILEFNKSEFRFRQFTLDDSAGTLIGSAVVRRDRSGEHMVRLMARNLSVSSLWSRWAPPDTPSLEGQLSGFVELKIPVSGRWDQIKSGDVNGTVTNLKLNEEEVGAIKFNGFIEDGVLTSTVTGSVFGGQTRLEFEIQDIVRLLEMDPELQPTFTRVEGSIKSLQLEKLIAISIDKATSRGVTGTANISFQSKETIGESQSYQGRLSIVDFKHFGQSLVENLDVQFDQVEDSIQLTRLTGAVAGGRLEATGGIQINSLDGGLPSGQIVYSLSDMDAGRIINFFYPQYAKDFAGVVAYRGRCRISRDIVFTGAASVSNGIVFGLPIQDARSNLQVTFSTSGQLQNLIANSLSGTALGGSLSGRASLRGGTSLTLKANTKINRGRLEQLSRALGFERIVGSEFFNANFALSSRDAPDLNALQGQIQMDFGEGDARSIPILSDLNRLIPLTQLSSTQIQSGVLHAQIGQGVLRIQDLLLNSESFWLAARGTASLSTGRLDLQTIVQTGGGLEAAVSQDAVRRIATLVAPEIAIIAEFDRLLRNRTVYLRIRGTTDKPLIQPKIAPSLARLLLQEVRRELIIAPSFLSLNE